MNLKQLNKRLKKEFDDLIQIGLDWSIEHDENEHVYFVDKAYEFAFFNEIMSFFHFMNEEEYTENWKDDFDLLGDDVEILTGIYEYYHLQDRYVFDRVCFYREDDLLCIISDWLAYETSKGKE